MQNWKQSFEEVEQENLLFWGLELYPQLLLRDSCADSEGTAKSERTLKVKGSECSPRQDAVS